MEDLDFAKNCVFVDEAGFNLHTQRNFGRSLKRKSAKAVIPTDISVKKPEAVSAKKRKADGKEVKVNGKVGTRTEHYLSYLSNVMDVMDKNGMKGHYIVMDNAPIHKPRVIRRVVEERGYKCL
ncbi:hypothetical protein VTP01DRAFT_7250 [Rhizomucor pusillus]|uniref:uncharacterized protein n=1 Tax=Rhizomucor pusillus TaxID=4840 RepID=UPI003742F6B5